MRREGKREKLHEKAILYLYLPTCARTSFMNFIIYYRRWPCFLVYFSFILGIPWLMLFYPNHLIPINLLVENVQKEVGESSFGHWNGASAGVTRELVHVHMGRPWTWISLLNNLHFSADVKADAHMKGKLFKRKGLEYVEVKDTAVKLTVKGAFAHFGNLFNGDPTLSEYLFSLQICRYLRLIPKANHLLPAFVA